MQQALKHWCKFAPPEAKGLLDAVPIIGDENRHRMRNLRRKRKISVLRMIQKVDYFAAVGFTNLFL